MRRLFGPVLMCLLVLCVPALGQAQRIVPQSTSELQLSFAPVTKTAAPAVVNVYATTVTQQAVSPFANDPFFRRFFGENSPFFSTRPRTSQSLGSGVIVDGSGLILTNHHVIENATDIRVTLTDRREFGVDLILDDPQTDLAVLRIRDAGDEDFPFLEFSSSDGLEVGDLVLAIGNPFGVGQTVTSGIVSALARTGVETTDYDFFIQTDAAINPGNSGGALVDMQGRLVGINTAIFTRSGGSIGIGFAIPSDMALQVANSALSGADQVVRPWLGARLQDINPDIARGLGLERPQGALISDIAPGGPAERAGLRAQDVVLSVDGVPVDDSGGLGFRLATKPVGTTTELQIDRMGKTSTIQLELIDTPYGEPEVTTITAQSRFQGTTAAQLTPQLAEERGLPYTTQGIVVTAVEPRSPAGDLGLREGDVILSLNREKLETLERFSELASQRVDVWLIEIGRDGRVLRSQVSG